MHAIELLRVSNQPILGGDVYSQINDQIDPTYDNWSFDHNDYPSHSAYAQGSWDVTQAYIERYPNPKNQIILFVLVLGKK